MKKYATLFLVLILFSCSTDEDSWTPLFNGENLEGWHLYGGHEGFNGWYVENGILIFDGAKRTEAVPSNLVTDKDFTDFELSMEWMIGENGNSGVFWGVIEDEKYEHPYVTGPEIQILDDGWTEYIEERGDINRAGSLYNLLPPSKIVSKPSGEWNHYLIHIDHTNNEGFLIFNDEKVVEFPVHGAEWEEMIANSGFSKWEDFGTARTGKISLQEYGGRVAFRNVKIRELP